MPVPIIDSAQSILSFRQGEYFVFSPGAFNSPTDWVATRLPRGVRCDPYAGRIYGACEEPGIYIPILRAYNASGWSAERTFTIGIENNGVLSLAPWIDLEVDIVSRNVYLPRANAAATPVPASLFGKRGDTLPIRLRFTKNATAIDLPLTSLKVSLKEFEPEASLVLTDSAGWRKQLAGASAYYELLLPLTTDAFKNALSNYEADRSTEFQALAEIEWSWPLADWPGGSVPITNTSQTFAFRAVRDQIPNA